MSSDRLAALQEIRRNIDDHGLHIYGVTGGPYPHYVYTIGLSDSLGGELVMAGAYFYELDEVPKIIKKIAAQLRDGWPGLSPGLAPLPRVPRSCVLCKGGAVTQAMRLSSALGH